MESKKNILQYAASLYSYNTMGIDARCPGIEHLEAEDQLPPLLDELNAPYYVLGGGSNVLLPDLFDKIVIHNEIPGIEILDETEKEVFVKAGGGVRWHKLVRWAVENDYYGIENLSLIPGSVGAAPIQNIGAYGVELKDVLHTVRYFHISENDWNERSVDECRFSYRNSIFKGDLKGDIFISGIVLQLSKVPEFNLQYGALEKMAQIDALDARKVSDAVIAIRQSKLPDPDEIGNCGSFFRNPVVQSSFAKAIKQKYPDMPCYAMGNDKVKIPAAWLIEMCGLKGKRYGNVGCYAQHALVIVNFGGATSREIKEHVNRVKSNVNKQFSIELQAEVNIL